MWSKNLRFLFMKFFFKLLCSSWIAIETAASKSNKKVDAEKKLWKKERQNKDVLIWNDLLDFITLENVESAAVQHASPNLGHADLLGGQSHQRKRVQ